MMHCRTIIVGALATNCYIIWDDQKNGYILDPGDESQRIADALTEEGLVVRAIILTHAHFDHMLAVASLQSKFHCPLWIGEYEEPALTDPDKNLSASFCSRRSLNLHADRLLTEGETLLLGNCSFRVWHTPGHTVGGICLVGEQVIFTGDTLFAGSIGRSDFPGGNSRLLQDSLRKLMSIAGDRTVYAGHGPATTLNNERQNNPYIVF